MAESCGGNQTSSGVDLTCFYDDTARAMFEKKAGIVKSAGKSGIKNDGVEGNDTDIRRIDTV